MILKYAFPNQLPSLLFAALALIPCTVVSAQNDISSDSTLAMLGSESMYFEDMPVIISATRLSQPLNESPVSTTVIDRQMIDASGARTIADILRLVPGFTVGYLNGNRPVATYHGQSTRLSNRIQLVIDGRSVYLPTLAGVSWSDLIISLEDIERFEVIRGPNASTYGNNAFLAVISITTKHASEEKGHYIKGTVGAKDTADAFYRFADQVDNLDYRVSVGTKNNSGTDLLDDFTATDFLNYRMDYQANLDTQLYYAGGLQDSVYGDVKENNSDPDNNVDVTTAFQHFRLEHNFDNGNSLAIQYYYNYTKSYLAEPSITFSLANLGPPFTDVDDFTFTQIIDLESVRHDLELSYFYEPLDTLRLVSGTSIRSDKSISNNLLDPGTDTSLMLYRFFTHGEYSVTSKLIMNAGAMLENNQVSGTDISPRLAFIYHANNQHSFRLSASKGTRTPTNFEENGYYAIQQQLTQNNGQPLNNPTIEGALGGDILNDTFYYTSGNLNSEKITAFELGWMARLLNNQLTLDIKLFHDYTDQLIEEIPFNGSVPNENIGSINPNSSGATDISNVSSSKTLGLEFYGDYNISKTLRLYAYYAYTEITAKVINSQVIGTHASITGRLEESSPKHSLGGMLMKQWPNNLSTNLSVYYVADMDWLDRTSSRGIAALNYRDRSAESYTKIDLMIRKSHKTADGRVDYSLIFQNIGSSYFDYTRTNYTDASRQTIDIPGSEQDPRGYFEIAFKFN